MTMPSRRIGATSGIAIIWNSFPTPHDALQLSLGQTENKTEFENNRSSHFGATWQINAQWSSKLLYSESFRSPFLLELYVSIPNGPHGNSHVVPETMRSRQLSLRYQKPDWFVEAVYFDSPIRDVLDFRPAREGELPPQEQGPNASIMDNRGQLQSSGGELQSSWQLNEQWKLDASYSLQHNQSELLGADAQLSSNYMLKTGLSWLRRPWSLGLFNSHYSRPKDKTDFIPESSAVADNNPSAIAYNHLTLHIGYEQKAYTLKLFVDNALQDDTLYYPDLVSPNINTQPAIPGRRWWLQLDIRP